MTKDNAIMTAEIAVTIIFLAFDFVFFVTSLVVGSITPIFFKIVDNVNLPLLVDDAGK